MKLTGSGLAFQSMSSSRAYPERQAVEAGCKRCVRSQLPVIQVLSLDIRHAALSVADLHKAAGVRRSVELRMHHAGARRHILHCAAPERLAVAQRVLVRQAAVHHVCKDLSVAVRVLPARVQLGC